MMNNIHPSAIVENCVRLGSRINIGPHTVIGYSGFEYRRVLGNRIHVPPMGEVIINDGVDIRANVCIDRATYPFWTTEIGANTKIDSNVYIAHDVKIGEDCMVIGCAMIAGRVEIGNRVYIGPGAVISDGIRIGDDAYITIGSVVTRDVKPGEKVTGNFAVDHHRFIEHLKGMR